MEDKYIPQWDVIRIYHEDDMVYFGNTLYQLKKVRKTEDMSIGILCFVPIDNEE